MKEQQVREIAEAVFKARFRDIDIVTISVEPDFSLDDEPLLDVRIVYDAEVERLISPDGRSNVLDVRTEIIEKVWEAPEEDSPVWPQIHFISKSDFDRRQQQTAA